MVANHEAADHHGQRARHVQVAGKRVAAHGGGQRKQHLDLILVDAAQQSKRHIAQHQTECDAAARFTQQ